MMKKLLNIYIFCFFLFITACSKEVKKNTITFYAMDTFISITFYDVENYKEIGNEIENIYLEYDAVASDYTSGKTVVSVYDLNLNREGQIDSRLKELLEFSLEMYEDTDGYFNPFIGRLSHLWKEALDKVEIPDDNIIKEELEIMKNTSISINDNTVKIIGAGNIDLGGIAKGFATNKAKAYLDEINCKDYLLNAGTSNIVLGTKKNEPFKVGLSCGLKEEYYYILDIKEKAVSTSSIKEQHKLIDGKYYSHLINPLTGYPADYYETLSIIGDDSGILDAYSTACFCMELEDLKQFIKAKGLDFIVSSDNKLLYKSEGVDLYA